LVPETTLRALCKPRAGCFQAEVISPQENLFASPHLNADFVLVIFHACLKQALERLEAKTAQQAVSQSGLPYSNLEISNICLCLTRCNGVSSTQTQVRRNARQPASRQRAEGLSSPSKSKAAQKPFGHR
jgi:hypothetical protein